MDFAKGGARRETGLKDARRHSPDHCCTINDQQVQQMKPSQSLRQMQQLQPAGLLYGYDAGAEDDEHVERR